MLVIRNAESVITQHQSMQGLKQLNLKQVAATVRFIEVGGAGISALQLAEQAAQDSWLQSSSANATRLRLLLGALLSQGVGLLLSEKLREISGFAIPRACGFGRERTERPTEAPTGRHPHANLGILSVVPDFWGAPPPNLPKVAEDEPPKSRQPEENSQRFVQRRLQDAGRWLSGPFSSSTDKPASTQRAANSSLRS